ncbi:hypothetical protein AXG89_37225 [Burkholderia sp. PAMC 26561]|nr:hypothetical protein AXG89_37225 [Burkholderia sp. PAMC 26561]
MQCLFAPDPFALFGPALFVPGATSEPDMLRKTLTLAMSALLPGAFASNVSPTELTTISVSLIVQESCMIQSAVEPSPVVRPSVSCLHGQPYDIALVTVDPAQQPAALYSSASAGGPAAPTVWMVGF